jgi:RNAse (barnase) inhibitor barstar
VVIALGAVHEPGELHDALARALGFPAWYGRNWDAFWDAITGLVEMPRKLRFEDWSLFEARLPREASLLRSALLDMVKQYPRQAPRVVYA